MLTETQKFQIKSIITMKDEDFTEEEKQASGLVSVSEKRLKGTLNRQSIYTFKFKEGKRRISDFIEEINQSISDWDDYGRLYDELRVIKSDISYTSNPIDEEISEFLLKVSVDMNFNL